MEESQINQALADMEKDLSLKTSPSMVKDTADSVRIISFSEKHAAYLKAHPKVIAEYYLSNLRTMIKIRT
jgi:hypothetical protein